jgi:hypothetical protein
LPVQIESKTDVLEVPGENSGSTHWAVRPDKTILTIHLFLTIGFALILGAVTHPLWISWNHQSFPKIPFFGILTRLSSWWDNAILAGLVFGLVTMAAAAVGARSFKLAGQPDLQSESPMSGWLGAQSLQRIGLLVALICGTALIALNQHRLQAWFYQLLLFLVAWNLQDSHSRLRWLQWLVISIYAFSALGKLDFEFLNTVGQDFVAALASPLGIDINYWSRADRLFVAGVMPVVELSLAVGLLRIRTRRAAGYAAAVFHLGLVWILGYQLQHSWGVVVWNLQFSIQAIVLFALPMTQWTQGHSVYSKQVVTKAILLLAIVMPVAERLEYWDHWPSWALYAPHTSRAKVWIAPAAIKRLPNEVRALARVSASESPWGMEIPLDQWSLTALKVPIYPQARFQLGVARYLAEQIDSQHGIRVELWSPASRWDGYRSIQRLDGKQQIDRAAGNFWLSSRPRR